jgi:RNA polymerase sigma-70 factor, ECF subfamily
MHRLHGERSAQEPRKQPPPPGTDRHTAAAQELPPPATLPDRTDADEMLERLLRLPVEQREMLVLVVLERLSYADIAALLDVPIETVMSRLCCARAGMRDSEDR